MLKLLAVIAVVTISTGCTLLQKKVVPLAQEAVTKYCAVPAEERALVRQQVNAAIAPNSIVVTCATPTP